MPYAKSDGVKLYYEETGSGNAIIFSHEFAADYRGWEPQMQHFGRVFRCITYSSRGYPPSDVPSDPAVYNQAQMADDIRNLMDHLDIEKAHIVGLSMGGFATLHFGLRHPERAKSLTVAGCGYGASHDGRDQFIAEAEAMAKRFEDEGSRVVAESYARTATRVQFETKDPRGWRAFKEQLAEHSAVGSAATLRGYQITRPSLFDIEDDLKKLTVPTLIVSGDEDDPCLEPDLFLKRTIPSAGLSVIPKTGHTINLEEPDLFNSIIGTFFSAVEAGRWGLRDPRSFGSAMRGPDMPNDD